MQIILLGPVSSRDEAQAAAHKCKALKVRGQQVWLWCRHLARTVPDVQLDEGALAVYQKVDGVPIEWVDSMVHATTQSEADELLTSMQQARAGPASDHLTEALRAEQSGQVCPARSVWL